MDPTPVLKTLKPIAPRPTEVVPAGYLQLPVRCLLCDIYGTLLVSAARQTRRQTEALDALLLKYGQRIHADALLNHFHDAIEKAHTCARAQGVDFPEVKIENIWEKVLFAGSPGRARSFALEFEILMNPVWPMPGLPELLSAARRFSIVMGIISNAQFYTPIIMEYLLGRNLESAGYASELTFFSFEHGRAKPSRHLFQLAVNRLHDLGVAPRETAYIGNDMRNDIVPADTAGFQTILFAGDRGSLRLREDTPRYAGVKPCLTITHLEQLTRCLSAQG